MPPPPPPAPGRGPGSSGRAVWKNRSFRQAIAARERSVTERCRPGRGRPKCAKRAAARLPCEGALESRAPAQGPPPQLGALLGAVPLGSPLSRRCCSRSQTWGPC